MPKNEKLEMLANFPCEKGEEVYAFLYSLSGKNGLMKGPYKKIASEIVNNYVANYGPTIVHFVMYKNNRNGIYRFKTFDVYGLNTNKISINTIQIIPKQNNALTTFSSSKYKPFNRKNKSKRRVSIYVNGDYIKTIREMPNGWLKEFNPYVPAIYRNRYLKGN